jgi:hypothetical protein
MKFIGEKTEKEEGERLAKKDCFPSGCVYQRRFCFYHTALRRPQSPTSSLDQEPE